MFPDLEILYLPMPEIPLNGLTILQRADAIRARFLTAWRFVQGTIAGKANVPVPHVFFFTPDQWERAFGGFNGGTRRAEEVGNIIETDDERVNKTFPRNQTDNVGSRTRRRGRRGR